MVYAKKKTHSFNQSLAWYSPVFSGLWTLCKSAANSASLVPAKGSSTLPMASVLDSRRRSSWRTPITTGFRLFCFLDGSFCGIRWHLSLQLDLYFLDAGVWEEWHLSVSVWDSREGGRPAVVSAQGIDLYFSNYSEMISTDSLKVAVMKSSGKFVVCDRGNERSRMQIFTKHGHFVRFHVCFFRFTKHGGLSDFFS